MKWLFLYCNYQGRIQPVTLRWEISVIFINQVSLRVRYCKRGDTFNNTAMKKQWGQNGLILPMLFSELYKIMVNKVTFVFGRRADRIWTSSCRVWTSSCRVWTSSWQDVLFFCSDNWVPATCLPKRQSMSMDARNTRSRKAIEILSQAINEPILKDLHAMLLSVIQKLDSIENDLLKRMTAVEESVENAHYNFTAMSV